MRQRKKQQVTRAVSDTNREALHPITTSGPANPLRARFADDLSPRSPPPVVRGGDRRSAARTDDHVPVTDMAEWLGHRDPRVTHQTYAHVMPDAPERLRSLMDAIFTTEIELDLPLEFEAAVEAA